MRHELTPADLAERVSGLRGDRVVVGVAGAPGAGKSTLAAEVAALLPDAVVVPMDGFHLADVALAERGLLERKGAIETFDASGYLALLRRIRSERGHDVLAPGFERDLEQPLAAAVTVPSSARAVITEGNYLLDAADPWPQVRAELDEVWFVDTPGDVRRERLVQRHVRFGKSAEQARAWVDAVDEPNARRVLAGRDRADLLL